MASEIRAGASGFSYKEWLGGFYPAKLAGAKMLEFYSARLATVEINYTFRAMPRRAMLTGWAEKTPPNFRFALKAPQRITHFARLRGSRETLDYFIEVAGALGEKLGPVLFQLPPDLSRDDALLDDFIAQVGGRVRAAFEFRHPSWFDEEVLALLRRRQVALCVAESDKLSSPVASTAPYAYLRLRKESYDDAAMAAWAEKIRGLTVGAREAYIYFKHEAAAPELAAKMQLLLATV
ncbi:MAG TPA: DUF72 domain-containing protein [Candidatus Binataceae bacterium]|nr:DUF72 domain-containing protein [Candidatus Binataceae bacterium]